MGKVLGIVYRTIATHLIRKAGYTKATARTGAVTLIQCFGGALNLHIFTFTCCSWMVFTLTTSMEPHDFRRVKAPTSDELTQLTHTIAHRVGRYLERQSLLVRDDDNSYLTTEGADTDNESPLNHLLGSSITYRIAMGPQQGRKLPRPAHAPHHIPEARFTLQTLPDCADDPLTPRAGNVAGFSLHAGVAARAHERDKLERLCRYIARPAVSTKRLS